MSKSDKHKVHDCINYRAKFLLKNLYDNHDSNLHKMRKAILKELMKELGVSLEELKEEFK